MCTWLESVIKHAAFTLAAVTKSLSKAIHSGAAKESLVTLKLLDKPEKKNCIKNSSPLIRKKEKCILAGFMEEGALTDSSCLMQLEQAANGNFAAKCTKHFLHFSIGDFSR